MRRSALELNNAWASVLATTNSIPRKPEAIMLLTALPPAPPTPNTVIRGLSSVRSGTLRLIVIAAFFLDLSSGAFQPWLEVVPNPLTHACEITGAGTQETLLGTAGELVVAARPMLEDADGAREIRTAATFRQAIQGARAPEAHRAAKHVGGKLGETGELAAPAGQHQGLRGL